MKKLLLLGFIVPFLMGCPKRSGHLTGVLGRPVYQPEIPLGMVYIPSGSYDMGENDQDVPFLHQTRAKTVSVQAFYIDQTEITNNEYRQFVEWVRDSMARELIYSSDAIDEEEKSRYINYADYYYSETDGEMKEFDPSDPEGNREVFALNWDRRFSYDDPELIPTLADLYYVDGERFYKRREIDTRKLIFEYNWIDL